MIQLASIYCFYIPNLTDGHGPRDILCMPLFLDMMFRYDAGNPVNGNRPTVNLHHIKTAQVFSIYLVIDIPYRVVGMHRIIAEVCCRDHPDWKTMAIPIGCQQEWSVTTCFCCTILVALVWKGTGIWISFWMLTLSERILGEILAWPSRMSWRNW